MALAFLTLIGVRPAGDAPLPRSSPDPLIGSTPASPAAAPTPAAAASGVLVPKRVRLVIRFVQRLPA